MALPTHAAASTSLGGGAGGGGGPTAVPPTAAAAASAPSLIASLRGVSAHGLVSLERAEGILQRVIDTVNDQALQISSLFLLVQTLVTTSAGGGGSGDGVRLPR